MRHNESSLKNPLLPISLLFVVLAAALWPAAPANAEQFTCIDQDYIHNKWYYHESFPWQPNDWVSPVAYATGTAYFRVEVRGLDGPIDGWYTSNSNQNSPPDFVAEYFAPQLCLFQDAHIPSKHACFYSGTIQFNQPGIYYGSQPLPDMYQYGVIDWTRLLMNPMIIGKVKNASGLSYYGQNVDMRYSVIIVAEGDTFDPPAWWNVVSAATDLENPVPTGTALVRNYPNPFNPSTTIQYELAEPATVSVRVFDLAGHAVRTLVDGRSLPAGSHEVLWRGRDDSGRMLPGGVYSVRLDAGDVHKTLRMTLLK
ncbi:MAG: FlgD immunoglobulin-like domain containing protein [Candidatus Krumholzibacteriota bacterium]